MVGARSGPGSETNAQTPTSRFVSNVTLQFDAEATNASDRWPRISNSYTSLVRTGPDSALVFYELKGAYGFAMPIKLINDSFVHPSGDKMVAGSGNTRQFV